ncbi:MAG: hypothetical protein KBT04_02580, partial [Bacteroidales bacterium]|nr:hypothetical protein [Candidatus Colimorpha onthohippi]
NIMRWDSLLCTYGNNAKCHFRITANISISAAHTIDTLCGTIDGNHQTITLNNCTLTKTIKGGTVKDLTLTGTISSMAGTAAVSKYVGCAACYITQEGKLSNITNNTSVSISDIGIYFGGLCGWLQNGTINHCANKASITNDLQRTSGIAVCVDTLGVVINSYNNGVISGTSCGGIAVYTMGKVLNSYALADLHGNEVAGLVTFCRGGLVDNCYFYGHLYATETKAPLCCTVSLCGTVQYCYFCDTGQDNLQLSVIRHNNPAVGNIIQYTYLLSNATTLSSAGAFNSTSLLTELNNHVPAISQALQWTTINNQITL